MEGALSSGSAGGECGEKGEEVEDACCGEETLRDRLRASVMC